MIKLLTVSFLIATGIAAVVLPSWNIGEDYAVRFSTKKAEGTFSDLQGTVIFDPNNLTEASFNVSVATASIETGNNSKNKHARGKAWFDAEAHPRITFVSKEIIALNQDYRAAGDLTIKGVTKSVSIDFTFTQTATGGLFTGKTSITRADYGLDGPFLFGGLVGDVVAVELKVPVGK
ncbi:MAG: YceI family protein [Bacteroidota bacterium]